MNFNKSVNRKNTNSIKWDYAEKFIQHKIPEDAIEMWVADMEFETPEFINDELIKRCKHPIYGYTHRPDSFYEAIINWVKKRNDWNIKREYMNYSPGVVTSLILAIKALTKEKDKIIIQPPVYFPFFSAVEDNNRILIENKLIEKNGIYHMDFEDLESKIDEKTKMILLCSPHNPVSRVWTKEELKKLGEIAVKHDLIILADEIHSDIVFEGSNIPIASISEEISNQVVTFMSPSKTFNLGGLFTAVSICSNKEMRDKLNAETYKLHLTMSNIFGMTAFEAAYKNGEEWVDELIKYISKNALIVENFFEKENLKVKVTKSQGTYLMWLDFREYASREVDIQKYLIDEAKVVLHDGKKFSKDFNGYLRMNIACTENQLKEALINIKNALDRLEIIK